ncbi:MAG: 4'-phosphopantetheinyl transferase superfamily protein [Ferruginibacter sp.]
MQHLAGRLVLSELYEDFPIRLIQVADTKKPFLPDEAFHFSISHCGDYAAAIVSRQNRVGVDIETPQPKIGLIKNKYLKADEQEMLEQLNISTLRALTMAWSVKESMFKWYALGNVDFKEHMHIHAAQVNDNQFLFSCSFRKEAPVALKVHGIFFNENCLTWLST